MLRRQAFWALGVALALVLAGCSGDDPVFEEGTFAPDSSSAGTDTPPAVEGVVPDLDPEGEEEFDPFEFGLNYDFADEPIELTSDLGGSDGDAAAALLADLESGGVDLTGMNLSVFDVNGVDDRLLVMDINRGVEQVPEDSDSADLLEVLVGAPSFEESGVTQLVINFFGTDQDGDFVVTTTMGIEAFLAASESEEDLDPAAFSDLAQIEIFRVPTAPTDSTESTVATSTTTSTEATATTTAAPSAILVDTFDADTTLTPLFSPGVMSTTVTGDGTFEMSVFATGVIPAMYPDVVPDDVIISFDFNPMPNNSTAGFGALVLSEEPADGALDHYLSVWANPSDGVLTIIPFDQGTGGWGAPVSVPIPAEVGFAADAWHRMGLTLTGGTVEVSLNFVPVTTWSGATPVTSGHWGPVIIAAASGDSMLVDNVLVRVNE